MSNNNTLIYDRLLSGCLMQPANQDNIKYEWIDVHAIFDVDSDIDCSNKEYIQHELDWYLSQDLNINGHEGIETNPVWKVCATEEGSVNSNYGWCLWSKENNTQFMHAIEAMLEDRYTKHAVMIYSRPTINDEWNDNKHAHSDMICTVYVNYLLRDGKVEACVHMRSNDIWRGLRNDLAWQQYVLKQFVKTLNGRGLSCECGRIHWTADSLHLYERDVDKARKYMREKGYLA